MQSKAMACKKSNTYFKLTGAQLKFGGNTVLRILTLLVIVTSWNTYYNPRTYGNEKSNNNKTNTVYFMKL